MKLRKLALVTLFSLLAAALAGSAPTPVQACIITCPPNWCSDCQSQGGQCALVNCQCACITTHH